jgi:hypothetical protein
LGWNGGYGYGSTIGTETIGVGMAVLDGTIGTEIMGLEQLGLEWRFWME